MVTGQAFFISARSEFSQMPSDELLARQVDDAGPALIHLQHHPFGREHGDRVAGALQQGSIALELLAFFFGLFAGRVVGANQQVADDALFDVTERGDRHDGGEPAAVLAKIGQLVDVLETVRSLERQRLEPRSNVRPELGRERPRARDELLGIGDVRRGYLVDDLGGPIAEHSFGAHVEDLDHAAGVGGDAGEVGAVEDRPLEDAGLEEGRGPSAVQPRIGGAVGRQHPGLGGARGAKTFGVRTLWSVCRSRR